MGRATKLTAEVQESICQAIRAGNTKEVAAEFVGIDRTTLFEWIARGKGTDERPRTARFADFADAVAKAEAAAVVRNVAIIEQAAAKNWQAAAWWLERRHRGEWAKTENHNQQVSGLDGGPIQYIEVHTLPPRVETADDLPEQVTS